MSRLSCEICPRRCQLAPGEIGFCRARQNQNGRVVALNYGKVSSVALDPIEKKPLTRFYPGNFILSVGGFGCNLRCSFCQNHEISQVAATAPGAVTSPETLVKLAVDLSARPPGNLGVAFTYNEPFVNYEFVLDTAKLIRKANLKTILVTNGIINEKPLNELLPYIDAANIDLKAFDADFYRWIGGNFETVKRTIELAAKKLHIEITNLIIPGKNDSETEVEALASWLAKLSEEIPLHITRYFPRYKLQIPATDPATVFRLTEIARKHLRYVYAGNC